MSRRVYADADADRCSFSTTETRRRADIEFLALVREASVAVLLELRRRHRRGPAWRLVAIERALTRHGWSR